MRPADYIAVAVVLCGVVGFIAAIMLVTLKASSSKMLISAMGMLQK